jgi:hypothetical protein
VTVLELSEEWWSRDDTKLSAADHPEAVLREIELEVSSVMNFRGRSYGWRRVSGPLTT